MELLLQTIQEWLPGLLSWIGSSAAAGLLASFINWLLAYRKEQNRLRITCRILFIEVKRHKYWLELLVQRDKSCVTIFREMTNVEWDKLKYELGNIPYADFETLITHYNNMEVIKAWATEIWKEETFNGIPDRLLSKKILTVNKAYKILYDIAKPADCEKAQNQSAQ